MFTFLKIAENISGTINCNNSSNNNNPSYSSFSLFHIFNHQYSSIVFHNTSSGEIDSVIKNFPGNIHVS
jgi:hypothetical protein